MHTGVKRQIIVRANAERDVEICGLIYAENDIPQVRFCQNIASDDHADTFEIDPQDYIDCLKHGRILGCFHSHPNGPAAFSPADLETAEEMCVPFYLYDVSAHQWLEYVPRSHAEPLEGRRFSWGFDDCFGLVRGYFRQNLSLHIQDYDRDETFATTPPNVIMENFANEGFSDIGTNINDVRLHDALLFDEGRRMPQHLGIFVGNSRILHHRRKMLSTIELIDGDRLKYLRHILRHKSL